MMNKAIFAFMAFLKNRSVNLASNKIFHNGKEQISFRLFIIQAVQNKAFSI